jgi:hypothetical protein
VLHALLDIRDHDDLLGHPVRGRSWEGLVVEQVIAAFRSWRPSFFRTQAGAEIDLVLQRGRRRIGVECKVSSAPKPSRGFWTAMDDLSITESYVVAPVDGAYPIAKGTAFVPLADLVRHASAITAGAPHPVPRRR